MEGQGVFAEQSATGIGAAIGAAVTLGGFLWSARGNKTDSASKLVDAALALVEPLQARVSSLEVELAKCNEKHEQAESVLREAGLM